MEVKIILNFHITEASFSTLRIDVLKLEWGIGNENANFFGLVVDNADNCFQDEYRYLNFFSFSTLCNCYTPYFKTPHTSIFSILPNIDIPQMDSTKTET